ncbi:MAG TPA: NAD(P)-dependent alcohol dehydrogenase [Vicinamibacterales bacterium]|nr:NAD(P)-dependent alcohol dehydrogenase [Vicinamibacterales bacterium]
MNTRAYAAFDPASPLGPFSFDRRDPGPTDVRIDILFCGVCHSDLHTAKGEWAGVGYPCVPGHEIAGRVTAVGKHVKGFKAGDLAAVGCMVDSCRTCASCQEGLEQFCDTGKQVFTYNTPDPHRPGERTYGGYSSHIVVDEAFCLRLPSSLDTAAAAPLLCAGITTYSPLRHWKAGPGKKVGIVGLGGLGHMAVKFSHAFGAETVLFTTSPGKVADGKRLGADEVVISKDDAAMKAQAGTFDLIINTVAFSHNLDPFIALLKRDSSMVLLGAPQFPHPSPSTGPLIFKRRALTGSLIGGIRETQEMLDFCGQKNIVCDIETISMQKINEAYERMAKSDVKYRFVIDMATL